MLVAKSQICDDKFIFWSKRGVVTTFRRDGIEAASLLSSSALLRVLFSLETSGLTLDRVAHKLQVCHADMEDV